MKIKFGKAVGIIVVAVFGLVVLAQAFNIATGGQAPGQQTGQRTAGQTRQQTASRGMAQESFYMDFATRRHASSI